MGIITRIRLYLWKRNFQKIISDVYGELIKKHPDKQPRLIAEVLRKAIEDIFKEKAGSDFTVTLTENKK